MHSKQDYKWILELLQAKDSKNSPTEGEDVSPQALDQSNKEAKKSSMTLAKGVSMFSKVRLFLSLQIVHIRHEGIKFQTPEDLFPNQFHQPNNSSETWSGSTQSNFDFYKRYDFSLEEYLED
jgi:hypothetical protein